jgi:hypothetical protein
MPDFEGTSYLTSSAIAGAVRWAAPEVFYFRPNGDTSLRVSTMSDVYAFGGIMYQVCADPEELSYICLISMPGSVWSKTLFRHSERFAGCVCRPGRSATSGVAGNLPT